MLQNGVVRFRQNFDEIVLGKVVEFHLNGETSLKLGNEVGHFGNVKSSCRYEQDKVRLQRAVFRLNGATFDNGKNIPLHALSGNVGTLTAASACHFVYLVDKHNAVLFRSLKSLDVYAVAVKHLFRFVVFNYLHRPFYGKASFLFLLRKYSSEDIAYVDTFLTGRNLNGFWLYCHFNFNRHIVKIALSEFGENFFFEFRIASAISVAADTIYSNVIATNITPFVGERQYPSIALRGDYNGWDFNNSQKVYSANEDNNYAGMIYFDGKAQNGWKFCGTEDWSVDNWGVGDGATAEQTPIILANNGSDIKIYSHNSYYFEFNNSTGELKVTWAYDSWGIVGDHNGWGSGDTKMTLASEVDNAGVTQYFLTATMDMEAGNTWKIRPDEKWENDRGPGSVELEGDAADNGNGNFRVDAAGNYTFKWYFNKVTQRLVVTKN